MTTSNMGMCRVNLLQNVLAGKKPTVVECEPHCGLMSAHEAPLPANSKHLRR